MNENGENIVEEARQETVKTFNEAKEQMKNINLKEEAEAGKGLLKNLWAKPIDTIKEIAADPENKTLKTALLLVAVWAIAEFVDTILYYIISSYATFNFLSILKITATPILTVIAMTLALYFVNNRAKTSISKVLTSVSVAYIPSIIASIIWLLNRISSRMSMLLTPIGGLLNVVTMVLMYHTIKEFVKKDSENHTFKEFVKVELVFYIIVFALSFLGISI